MRPLMEYVDVLIAKEEDSDKVLGLRAKGADVNSGSLSTDSYSELARTLIDTFGFEKVAITLRESISASVTVSYTHLLRDMLLLEKSRTYFISSLLLKKLLRLFL